MVANAFDVAVSNADGKTIFYIWNSDKTGLIVISGGNYSGNVVIPKSVLYKEKIYPVTSIGANAFQGCAQLTKVTIPDRVNSIGSYAFSGCSGLTSVSIPNSVNSIGNYAFYKCSGLTSVSIPNSVTNIGYGVFSGCSSLTSMKVDTSNTIFDSRDNCNAIIKTGSNTLIAGCKNTTIPNGVKTIDKDAFSNCPGLSSITIPNSLTSIGESAFAECSNLTSIIIGNGVTSIGANAFKNTNLKKVIWLTNTPPTGYNFINGAINYVSNNNFTSLNNTVTYPFLSSCFEVDGIRYIPVSPSERTCDAIDCVYDATANNTVIASTVSYKGISMNVKNIQPYLAYNNKYIENLKVDIDGKVSNYAFTNCSNMSTVTLGKKVSAIDQYAFQGCSKLQRIEIPNSVKSIGNYAFQKCSTLEYAQIGKGIETINDYTFAGCSSLKEMIIGTNVLNISEYAFSACSALPNITIPSSVSSIDNCVFSGCKSLKEVIMEDRAEGAIIQTYDNWIYSTDNSQMTINVTVGDTLSFDYEVTNGYLKVYSNYDGTTTYQGTGRYNRVFNFSGIITISCGTNSYTTIPIGGVANIKLSKTSNLFLGSNGGLPLFADCPLDSVYIGRNINYYASSGYGYSPFYRNTSLRAVKITDKETEISENEFYGCTNLQRVMIGDGVTTISDYAFSGCQSLKFFTFGAQVKSIGKEAFSDCTSVVEIASKAQTPPTCGTQALDDINKWNCKLFVPKGCIASYQAADQWKDFFFTEEGEGAGDEGSSETETKKCEKPTISYTNGQLSFASETEGAEFVTEIADSDIKRHYDANIQLTATYTISVYATKAGYDNSDVATATLCWIDVEPKTEGINNGIAQVPAKAVLIQAAGGAINVQGCDDGERIGIYSINGSQVGTAVSQNGSATVNTTLQSGSVAIIKVGKKSVKVVVK